MSMVWSEPGFLGGSGFGVYEIICPGFGPGIRSKISMLKKHIFPDLNEYQKPSEICSTSSSSSKPGSVTSRETNHRLSGHPDGFGS